MDTSGGARAWRGYAVLSLVWLVVIGGILLFMRRPDGNPIEILPPPTLPPTPTEVATPTPGPMHVDVAGAVQAPGVYSLPAGSIVADAIVAAGGPARDADLDRINKAISLQDSMQVYVPRQSEVELPARSQPISLPTEPASAEAHDLVDINSATEQELDALPGVGPVLAQRIIEGRPYGTVDDLLRVAGIGPATLGKFRDRVLVR
jgi:competence protein ComEA